MYHNVKGFQPTRKNKLQRQLQWPQLWMSKVYSIAGSCRHPIKVQREREKIVKFQLGPESEPLHQLHVEFSLI